MKQKNFMKPLFEFSEKYKELIDDACKEVHPREIKRDYLEFVSGKISFEDVSKDLTKSLAEPNWDILDRKRSRIRPVIFLLTIGGLGKNPDDFVKYSAIPELIHNGTLIHDDIEDNSFIRRNDKTIHIKYGLDIAVNSANLMYFSPLLILQKYKKDLSFETTLKAYEVIIEHLNRVTWGQALDIYWHNKEKEISIDQYFQMCCYKTGAIDRLTTTLASALTNRTQETHKKVEELGENLGIGFQIHDDFLDVCAMRREYFGGKPKGNDITEGKKSIVNIVTIQNLFGKKRKKFIEILQKHTNDNDELIEALDMVEESKALEYVLKIGQEQFEKLRQYCSDLFKGEYKSLFIDF